MTGRELTVPTSDCNLSSETLARSERGRSAPRTGGGGVALWGQVPADESAGMDNHEKERKKRELAAWQSTLLQSGRTDAIEESRLRSCENGRGRVPKRRCFVCGLPSPTMRGSHRSWRQSSVPEGRCLGSRPIDEPMAADRPQESGVKGQGHAEGNGRAMQGNEACWWESCDRGWVEIQAAEDEGSMGGGGRRRQQRRRRRRRRRRRHK